MLSHVNGSLLITSRVLLAPRGVEFSGPQGEFDMVLDSEILSLWILSTHVRPDADSSEALPLGLSFRRLHPVWRDFAYLGVRTRPGSWAKFLEVLNRRDLPYREGRARKRASGQRIAATTRAQMGLGTPFRRKVSACGKAVDKVVLSRRRGR